MATMADYRPKGHSYGPSMPSRKPVPAHGLQPLTQIHPSDPAGRGPSPASAGVGGVSPNIPPSAHAPGLADTMSSRGDRVVSTASQSSFNMAIGGAPPSQANLARQPTNNSFSTMANSSLRRTTSNRTTSSQNPTSYVALMRKQKGTVWCDRAQTEDPRLLAAQRAARQRAAMEIAGGVHSGTRAAGASSTGMVGGVRKIRHGGATKAQTYNPGLVPGVGVPMRLSASEVDEGDSDDDNAAGGSNSFVGRSGQEPGGNHHHRSGSGRSSLGSGKRIASYGPGTTQQQRLSNTNASTPSSGAASPRQETDETPMPGDVHGARPDYFSKTRKTGTGLSGGSGSSGERENSFGGIGQMPVRAKPTVEAQKKTEDELRRRGSVDDRTMTMSGVRLFVANPDLSD